LRWCFWHASFEKAEDKIRQALVLCRIIVAETPAFEESLRHLDYRLRDLWMYIEGNKTSLVAYAKRQKENKPISTAMAESAVNQIINARMCKRQQMRWAPRGAHLLAQVRCAVINHDLPAKLAAYYKKMSELPEHISRFLELLRRGLSKNPSLFNIPLAKPLAARSRLPIYLLKSVEHLILKMEADLMVAKERETPRSTTLS
ncbi:hypothetical protein HAV38_21530, partial [Glaciimonas immobilis]